MAKLTEARFKQAKPIFDRCLDQLLATQRLDAGALEKEMKDLWGTHYTELKGIIIDLAQREKYVFLAARYMESGEPGVAAEFKGPLAKLYRVDHYDAENREEKQKEFWARAFG